MIRSAIGGVIILEIVGCNFADYQPMIATL
jgi:hypothetical protein